jgi:dihydrofolate reductase
VIQYVRRLKSGDGPDIMLGCGAELFADLSTAGLINEYRFLVTPTVLGRGKSLFSALETRLRLRMLRATPSSGGGMLMEYEPKT